MDIISDSYNLCPECGSGNTIFKNGEIVCRKCGIVIAERCLDIQGGLNNFPTNDPLYPWVAIGKYSGEVGSKIRDKNKDDYGRKVTPDVASTMNRLRKIERRHFKTEKEKSIERVTRDLSELLRKARPRFTITRPMREEMKDVIQKALATKFHWHDSRCLTGAVFCFVYRKRGNPNPLKEIAKIINIKGKTLFKDYRKLAEIKEIKEFFKVEDLEGIKNYIAKISASLELPMYIEKSLFPFYEKIISINNFAGKDRKGIVAGLVYIMCKQNHQRRTQKDISEAAGITEVTLRTRRNEIEELLSNIPKSN